MIASVSPVEAVLSLMSYPYSLLLMLPVQMHKPKYSFVYICDIPSPPVVPAIVSEDNSRRIQPLQVMNLQSFWREKFQ